MNKTFAKADILDLTRQVYTEAGGKERMVQRARHYKIVPFPEPAIHNYYYVNKNVYDYSDLNATLGQAALFLGEDGQEALTAGKNYVEILSVLAEVGFLIEYTFCDRAFDGYASMLLVHTWLLANKHPQFSHICTPIQRRTIEDWFYDRAKRMWNDRNDGLWETFRPYDNQEIGIGLEVVVAEFLKQRDPELSENLIALADSRIVGWETKNGNTDDTLFYTPLFATVLYLYSVYRPKPELLTLDHCRQTFEGVLQQLPGNGSFTLYNWTQYTSTPALMALGAHIFQDGRYKWMACRLIEERMEQRNERQHYATKCITPEAMNARLSGENNAELREVVEEELARSGRYDHVWEGMTDNIFHLWLFWDDEIEVRQPSNGSMLLEKTAGQGRFPFDPEPILPDKAVLREGWGKDDLFAMINLWGDRNSPGGETISHRYPGANEIVTLVCGEQFVVQNNDQVTRDGNVRREMLNAFNLYRDGQWLNPWKKGKSPSDDIPQTYWMTNAESRFFECLPWVDATKSTLYDYFGWTSERTVLLCKGKYIVVFDQAYGSLKETAGVRWHLQGEEIGSDSQSVQLNLLGSKLDVLFPHEDHWYDVVKKENGNLVAVYQHHADLDLDLMATGTKTGFVTIFCPVRNDVHYNAEIVNVSYSGMAAYPEAMAVKIDRDVIGTRLGQYRNDYDYGQIKTDADAFVMRNEGSLINLAVYGARLVRLPNIEFKRIAMDACLEKSVTIEYSGQMLLLRFAAPSSGSVRIWQ